MLYIYTELFCIYRTRNNNTVNCNFVERRHLVLVVIDMFRLDWDLFVFYILVNQNIVF